MHRVVAECWLLGVVDGRLAAMSGPDGATSPTWSVEVPDGASPVAALVDTAPVRLNPAPPHSTSWRFDRGVIVLSFVAVAAEPLTTGMVAVEPYRPEVQHDESDEIGHARVLAHAARHVAFLLSTDPASLGITDDAWHRAAHEHVPTVFRSLDVAGGQC